MGMRLGGWRQLGLALLALSLGACQGLSPLARKAAPRSPAPGAPSGIGLPPGQLGALGGLAPQASLRLSGEVRLLSNHGAGVLSNATGQLLSNHGAGLVSDQGGGLLSNHGAGRRVLAAEVLEHPLAEALIEVGLADGRPLPGGQGQTLQLRTDAQGRFRFEGQLPAEALVLRLRLFTGGEMTAIVPKDRGGQSELVWDTQRSLGDTYVLRRLLAEVRPEQRAQALGRLPQAEGEALQAAIAKALGKPKAVPDYRPEAQEAQAEALRRQDPELAARLERIRSLLVAGVGVGDGQRATQATLSAPSGLARDAEGRLLIAELGAGRVRRLEAAGTLSRAAGGNPAATNRSGASAKGFNFDAPLALLKAPEGGVFLADRLQNRVYLLRPDGSCEVVLGTGVAQAGSLGKPTETNLSGPGCLALAPDGSLYVGEYLKSGEQLGRILVLSPDRQSLRSLPLPEGEDWLAEQVVGLCSSPKGTLWMLCFNVQTGSEWALWERSPEGVWAQVPGLPRVREGCALAHDAARDQLLLSTGGGHELYAWRPGGPFRLIAGTGQPGTAEEGRLALGSPLNYPAGMLVEGNELFLAETGSGLVRRLELGAESPSWRIVAGSTGLTQQGQAQSVGINGPAGLALDDQDRLWMAEASSSLIKRLEGNQLKVVAGSARGFGGDGGPALAGQFDTPGDMVFHQGTLYFLETSGYRLRAISPEGTLRTVAGQGTHSTALGRTRFEDPLQAPMSRCLGLAAAPDGTLFWTENEDHQIWRLRQGVVELVAGTARELSGEGADGPAEGNLLSSPVGLAWGPEGALYFSDAGNMRIRRLLDPLGPSPRVETYAGLGLAGTFARIAAGTHAEDGPRLASPVLAPASMCFDAQGRLYFCEVGTARIQSLGTSVGLAGLQIGPVGCRIRRIDADGRLRTVAGDGTQLMGDPDAEEALLLPAGIRFNAKGDLIVADGAANQVRLIPKALLPP